MIIDSYVIHGPTTGSSLGDLTFTASPDHATLSYYEARVRPEGSATVVATQNLGLPTPSGGICTVNIATTLNALSTGNYLVYVASVTTNGSTESDVSNRFSVPLVAA